MMEVVGSVQEVKVTDKTGAVRHIGVRYTDRYPTENNAWGEFQAHRRVLGVVTVGACRNQIELSELCRLHEASRGKYSSTVYDSRCIVFCATGKRMAAKKRRATPPPMEMTMETICPRTNLMKKETSRPLGFDHRITNKRGCCSTMAMQIVIRRAWSLTFRTLWPRCSGSWRANVWRPPERVRETNSPCFVLPLREKTLSGLTWRAGIIESGLWGG